MTASRRACSGTAKSRSAWQASGAKQTCGVRSSSSTAHEPCSGLVCHHVGVVQVQDAAGEGGIPVRHQLVVGGNVGGNGCAGSAQSARVGGPEDGRRAAQRRLQPAAVCHMTLARPCSAVTRAQGWLCTGDASTLYEANLCVVVCACRAALPGEGRGSQLLRLFNPSPPCPLPPLLTAQVEGPGHLVGEERLLEGRQRGVSRVAHRVHQARVGQQRRDVAHHPRVGQRFIHHPAGAGLPLRRQLGPHARQVPPAQLGQRGGVHAAVASLCMGVGVGVGGAGSWPAALGWMAGGRASERLNRTLLSIKGCAGMRTQGCCLAAAGCATRAGHPESQRRAPPPHPSAPAGAKPRAASRCAPRRQTPRGGCRVRVGAWQQGCRRGSHGKHSGRHGPRQRGSGTAHAHWTNSGKPHAPEGRSPGQDLLNQGAARAWQAGHENGRQLLAAGSGTAALAILGLRCPPAGLCELAQLAL